MQSPQFQPDANIATDYNQSQEVAHTIHNDLAGRNGEEQDDGKEDHHPPSARRCLAPETGKDSGYGVDAILHFAKTGDCVTCRIAP